MATADVDAILLNDGKRLITGVFTGFTPMAPIKFRVGNAAGFATNPNAINISGSTVFEGGAALIQVRRIYDDTVRYTLIIPESVGPMEIGNIILYAAHADNVDAPNALVQVVLPFRVKKEVSSPDLGNPNPFPSPGNRFVINITIRHSIEGDDVVVTVLNPEYSSLPSFPTQLDVPAAAINPWNQFVINLDDRTKTPTLVHKRSDGQYWGVPFWQNLRDPKFGVIDGGNTGDQHLPGNGSFLWGYFYTTPNNVLKGQIGGSGYIQDNNLGYVGTIGGLSY